MHDDAPPPDYSLQDFRRLRKYMRDGCAPWVVKNGRIGFLTTNAGASPLDIRVSPNEFAARLRARFVNELAEEATLGLAKRRPEESAMSINLGLGPRLRVALLLTAVLAVLTPSFVLLATAFIAATAFLALAVIRLALADFAQTPGQAPRRSPLMDRELPVVTILAPLFREASALPGLARAIERFDYPRAKIDLKLLFEESDRQTLNEALRLGLQNSADIIIVPPSHPQTKPKACNYGLQFARGDLIVIYDAEDEPESDQLRIAAETFAAADEDLACVQAMLNFYNPDENWLTRLFTLEYCLWFDHLLPALDRLGAPVPLGGTSNVFRTDILADVGGWDPFNVTEDADLGLRLARRGYRTAVIDSTTFEEANCAFGNWMRQRTRWMKGYIQTWLVHRRDMKFSGWRGALSVDLFIGGTALAALANPILWLLAIMTAAADSAPIAGLPSWAEGALAAVLAAGNLAFLALAAGAPLKRGLARLCPAALFVPVYWLMMSAAAWRALYQLLTRPSYWEKTDHGLSAEAKARRAAALRSLGLE